MHGQCPVTWSSNGKFFYTTRSGRWLAFPLAAGESLPDLTDIGISPTLKGVPLNATETLSASLAPGADPSVYVFQRTEIRSNLFRIPIH
jgi:hypothetical protein